MSTFEVIITIVVLTLVHLSNHVEMTDTNNIFLQINEKMFGVIEDLFIYLKLDRNFTKSKTAQEYMSMPNFIQGILRKNYKRYKEIENIIKSNKNNKTDERTQIINEVIDEMIREQEVRYNKSNHIVANHTSGKIETLAEFIGLAREFQLNVKTLVPNDFYVDTSNSSQESRSRRIFAGKTTSIERYPFMVSVHMSGRFVCAGSLVHESLALSAASCLMQRLRWDGIFVEFQTSEYQAFWAGAPLSFFWLFFSTAVSFVKGANEDTHVQIRFGSDYTTKMGVLVQIIGLTYHPEFDRTTLANNLVLLTTNKILRMKPGKVMVIKYDRWNPQLANVDDVVIVGWGRRSEDDKDDGVDRPLAEAQLDIYDLEECKYIYTRDYVSNKTFCAGFVERGDGACNHDGGGPAVVGGALVGVISFGSPRCGRADAPTVFTRLALYYDWLDETLNTFEAAHPPNLEVPDSSEIPDVDINDEESDEDPRQVLKREFGIEDILHGPIYTSGEKKEGKQKVKTPEKNQQEHLKNSSDVYEADLNRMYQEDLLKPTNDLSTDEDSLEIEQFQQESTPNPKKISVLTNTVPYEEFPNTYLMKKYSRSYISNKFTDTTKAESLNKTIKVTKLLQEVAISKARIAKDYETSFELKETNIAESESNNVYQLGNKNIEPNLSHGDDNKAIIILSDSGSTQRVEMHKWDPIYRKGIKPWIKSLNSDDS